MKEYERNAFGHVSSLAKNITNKSASFSCFDMGTRPLFRIFSTFQTLDYRISKNIQANPCGFILDNKKGPLSKVPSFIELHGTNWAWQRHWFENSQFFSVFFKCRFLKFKGHFLQAIMGKIKILLSIAIFVPKLQNEPMMIVMHLISHVLWAPEHGQFLQFCLQNDLLPEKQKIR